MGNKIRYGLKNVHVALQTCTNSVYTYGTPIAYPGAVSLTLDAQGEDTPFYADDIVYYRSKDNNGYSGSLETAIVPDWFRQQFLGEAKDIHNVLVEKSDADEDIRFALLFQFAGDVKAIRHVIYNVSASRPSVSGKTKENAKTPETETMNITADPREDGLVKCRTADDTDNATYNGWYNAVYVPTITS